MAAAEPTRYSLFASDTLQGLSAATAEAASAAGTGEPAGAAALDVCRQVAAAVAASDAGRAEEAASILAVALAETTDLRLLYVGYQFSFRSSDYERAEHYIRRRLNHADPDSPEAARAWNNLGLIYHFRGDAESAEAMMRRSLDIDTRAGHDEGVARDLGNLALLPEARGDLDAAEKLYRESLAVAERIGFTRVIGTSLTNLGDIAKARGQRDAARALWVRAVAAFEAAGMAKYRDQCARQIEDLDNSGSV